MASLCRTRIQYHPSRRKYFGQISPGYLQSQRGVIHVYQRWFKSAGEIRGGSPGSFHGFHDALLAWTANQSTDESTVLLSALVVSVAMGSVFIAGARSLWAQMEPLMLSTALESGYVSEDAGSTDVDEIFGIEVSQSKFFRRERVKKAVAMATKAHAGQFRKTGQPYITHCIETALIVEALLSPHEEDARAEEAVITAILHDVIDDGEIQPEYIKQVFGEHVMSMVTKVSQLSATNQLVRRKLRLKQEKQTAKQIDKLRTMIVTMVSEPLVIVIKLADRLHNMRTVYALEPDKQRAVAEETQKIWCSLAERLGMFALKSELEDLCFAVLEPSAYVALRGDLEQMWGIETIADISMMNIDLASERSSNVESCTNGIPELMGSTASLQDEGEWDASFLLTYNDSASFLTDDQIEVRDLIATVLPFDVSTFNMERIRLAPSARRGLEVLKRCAKALLQELIIEGIATNLEISVQGRIKSMYSSFKKMARKGVPLTEVYDLRALRVVVDDKCGLCEKEAIEICYKVLPAVHRLWRKVPGEDDDYIAVPKPSGYQSLHTAVLGPGGIPMEVQIRTSTMHEEAEYGKAAHWAYKEKSENRQEGAGGLSSFVPGHPVLRISEGGNLRDGVVIKTELNGSRLLVASSYADKSVGNGSPLTADSELYEHLYSYVTEKGYFSPSQGDMNVTLELFTLCSDGKYHQMDRFGHKFATTCVLLQLPEKDNHSTPESRSVPPPNISKGDEDNAYMNNRIKLLRSMIEWGIDVEDEVTRNPNVNEVELGATFKRDIMVLLWPSGNIIRVPKGTTAGGLWDTILAVPSDGEHQNFINVNNKQVTKNTLLKDGDFVVLTNDPVSI